MLKNVVFASALTALALGLGACSDDAPEATGEAPERAPEAPPAQIKQPAAPGHLPVHRVLGMLADWQIPDTLEDTTQVGDPDFQITGLPIAAAIGNEYTFDEGRGGSLTTAYIAVDVQESSADSIATGETVTVEIPMPRAASPQELADIDWGTEPWAFVVWSEGVFADGDVTAVRDLDQEGNPAIVGGTSAVSVFEVTDSDEVMLPIINEPALQDESVSSTELLGEQLDEEIESSTP